MRRLVSIILIIVVTALAVFLISRRSEISEGVDSQESPSPTFVSASMQEVAALSSSQNEEGTVVDIEGNAYKTVQIGTQVWMAENLRTTKFRDGQSIQQVIENQQWGKLTSPAYCWLNNDETNKDVYGALYNWYSMDTQMLAPEGWHIPSEEEWTTLINYLGGENIAGGKLKETGTQYWLSPNTGATDEAGFSARSGGNRNFDGLQYNEPGDGCYFWTSTASDSATAFSVTMLCDSSKINIAPTKKTYGRSIRCVKDEPVARKTVGINKEAVLPDAGCFGKTYSKTALQEDFEKLHDIIQTYHPKLYTNSARLSELLISQYALIEDGMTELEFLRVLAPIISALNCGHTSISLSEDYQDQLATEGKYFPLPLRFIQNHAYIVQNGMAKTIPLGSELLSINGISTEDIISTLFNQLTADGENETRKVMLLNGWFKYKYQNYMDDVGNFDIIYQEPGASETKALRLEGATNAELNLVNTGTYIERPVPFSSEFCKEYAVLSMYSFYPEGQYSLSDFIGFIDEFFLQCAANKTTNLVLDLRDNGGGDPRVTSHLFSYLEKAEQPYFRADSPDYYSGLKNTIPFAENHYSGDLFILMNGGSFSSTGHLLALLKAQGVGIFVGEESGGSFACTDNSQNFVLKNTKIQFRSSTQIWAVDAQGLTPGRGIMPDFEVIPTIQDYLDNIDVVKQTAIDMILEQ